MNLNLYELSDSSIAKAEQLSIVRMWRVITGWSTFFGRDITIIVCVLQSIPIPEVKKLKWREVTRLSYELVRCETQIVGVLLHAENIRTLNKVEQFKQNEWEVMN